MGDLSAGYDVLMILWGTIFVVAAAGFLWAMNRVFQTEEHRQDQSGSQVATTNHSPKAAA
jgi:hypothetical protein